MSFWELVLLHITVPKLKKEDLVVPVDAVMSNEEAAVEEDIIEPAGETEGGEASTAHCRTRRDTYLDYTQATLISYMIHWEACFSFVKLRHWGWSNSCEPDFDCYAYWCSIWWTKRFPSWISVLLREVHTINQSFNGSWSLPSILLLIITEHARDCFCCSHYFLHSVLLFLIWSSLLFCLLFAVLLSFSIGLESHEP